MSNIAIELPSPPSLDRMDSNPSLTHSASTTATSNDQFPLAERFASETVRAPVEENSPNIEISGESEVLMSPVYDLRRVAEEGRRGFGKLNLSKSVSSLRAKAKADKKEKAKSELGRQRASWVGSER